MTVTRSLTQPLTRPLAAAVTQGVGGGWTPNAGFFSGSPGLALDLTAMSTLYQDSARTTPVTAAGQPIGSPSDISGNGNHPTQASAGSRPTYNGFATFDGADDSWVTAALNFTGTDKVTVIASVYKGSDALIGVVAEFSADTNSNNGSFALFAPHANGAAGYGFRSKGTTLQAPVTTAFPAPRIAVVSGVGNIAAPSAVLRVDGADATSNGLGQGTGSFGNFPLYIGRRGGASLPLNGRIYRLIVIGRLLSASELASAERWCAAGAGLSF